jgi:hypothetical protein
VDREEGAPDVIEFGGRTAPGRRWLTIPIALIIAATAGALLYTRVRHGVPPPTAPARAAPTRRRRWIAENSSSCTEDRMGGPVGMSDGDRKLAG